MPRFGRGRGWGFGRGYWPRAGFGWGFGVGRRMGFPYLFHRFYPRLPARRWAMGMTPYAALYLPYAVQPMWY
jgi:hypothetical protein